VAFSPALEPPRLTRRRLLAAAAGGAAALGGAGAGAWSLLGGGSGPPAVRSFRSRPDLAVPRVTIDVAAPDRSPGLVFLAPSAGPGQHGALVVDDAGEPVWFAPGGKRTRMNFRIQEYEDRPVLTWWEGEVTSGHGEGEYVLADERYRELARVRAGNGLGGDLHEFVLTPRATAFLTAYRPLGADLRAVGGARRGTLLEGVVQEVDVASGRVLFEWRSSEHVAPAESYRRPPAAASTPFDYFHVNSVAPARDGSLLVSARHTSTVYKLDRRTGSVLWRLGGRRSDFALGRGVRFAYQHDAHVLADRTIALFDDGAPPQVEPCSRAIVVAADAAVGRARLVRAYVHPKHLLATAMGNMQPLADGGFFVGWGTQPWFTQFARDGRVLLDGRLPDGGNSYRAFRCEWKGRPAEPPALVAIREGGGVRAYASWNGATEVAFWAIQDRVVRRSGFETSIALPRRTQRVRATPLDARRRPLGSPRTAHVVQL
jgi:hypothetical protein